MSYKISIGSNIIKGPWGGGNQFAISLSGYLKKKGWEVVSGLRDSDIDIIVLTEPRITSETGAYNQKHISKYLVKKPDTILVHRINECDERKGTRGVNRYLMRANKVSDYTIFISGFLRGLFISKGWFKNKESSVVKNGADGMIFNRAGLMRWDKKSPLRLVTHHWGYSFNKGFDVYQKLAALDSLRNIKIQLTYIGRIPDNINYKNIKVVKPLSGKELAGELKRNHIYVTGSVNEPAGMHHIEGAMCGLPVLYRNSGALPEYCRGFGVMFEGVDDVESKLEELIEKYDCYLDRMKEYPYNSELMCREYENIFLTLLKKKNQLNTGRRRMRFAAIFIKELFFQSIEVVLWKLKNLIRRIKGLDD